MKEMFELEQAILDCWKITDDIPLLEEMQANSADMTSLACVYEFKFEKLWRIFEQLFEETRTQAEIAEECLVLGKELQLQSSNNCSDDYNLGRTMGIEVYMNAIRHHFILNKKSEKV